MILVRKSLLTSRLIGSRIPGAISTRKEVNKVVYNKPEVVLLNDAIRAVRGQTQKQSSASDSNPPGNAMTTPAAYEADE
jgi:hypothetical protein